jgi:hypothetical protein
MAEEVVPGGRRAASWRLTVNALLALPSLAVRRIRGRRRSLLSLLAVGALAVAACTSVGVSARVPAGPAVVELGFFYDELSPWGDWIWTPPWGRVWRPWGVGFGWVPYSHGRWVYTELGWSWISYWEWGWAPFHYGRWRCDPVYGWVWVPGTVWAPAWVVWRHGPGWLGWAPLPPGASWDEVGGLRYIASEVEVDAWSFVAAGDFLDTRIESRIEPRARNRTLVESSREVVGFAPHGTGVAERGLDRALVERVVGRPVDPRPIERATRPPRGARDVLRGDAVHLYRPEVRRAPAVEPRTGERPEPPSAGEKASQRRELQSWAASEQRRLDKIHERQLQQPPSGLPSEQLERRQRQEREALRAEIERRQQWLETRRERPKTRSQPPSPPKSKPPKQKPPAPRGR